MAGLDPATQQASEMIHLRPQTPARWVAASRAAMVMKEEAVHYFG
jgi:hypothetical protein